MGEMLPGKGETAPLVGVEGSPGLWSRLRTAFVEQTGGAQRRLLIAWAGFGVTFGVTRAITTWIHDGHGPSSGGMSVGGRHFHHYNLGILLLGGVGAVALHGREHHRHPLTAAAYGSGAALIIDEAALLIDLQDVYWAQDGRKSVDAAIGLIATGGAYLAAVPFWSAVTREITRSRPYRATAAP